MSLATFSLPTTDACPNCLAPLGHRMDAHGNIIRELCRICTPQEPLAVRDGKQFQWMPRLIAFTGAAQSGKTTCARWLWDKFGFSTFSFAAPLKRMLATLCPIDDKEARPHVLCGKTVREAMQTLGTEWGRNCIGGEIWLRAAKVEIEHLQSIGVPGVACDDVRFDNEAEMIRGLGGIVVALKRPGMPRMQHASEAGIRPDLITATISAENGASLIEQLDGTLARQ